MSDPCLKLTVRLDLDTVIEITMIKIIDDRYPGDPPANVTRALALIKANNIEKIE